MNVTAMNAASAIDLSTLFSEVSNVIAANLPSMLTVAAMIIGVTVVVRLFKRLAR